MQATLSGAVRAIQPAKELDHDKGMSRRGGILLETVAGLISNAVSQPMRDVVFFFTCQSTSILRIDGPNDRDTLIRRWSMRPCG